MSTKVAESSGYGPNTQMSLFGYIMAGILVIIALPLLPVIIPAYIIWRAVAGSEEREHSFEAWRERSGRPPSGS
ncbi:DUF7535 family protein [Natronorubrum sp. FCH18a]|uniref:DUF7535 family protein n=1 Tax=Natronorubrum sp. FCH18a TaxID=3447018 RepID=UPI003F51112C